MSMSFDEKIEVPQWAPCASCGVVVRGPEPDVDTVTVFGRPYGPEGLREANDLIVTRCAACRTVRVTAAAVLAAHPSIRGQIGDPSIALHRVECALSGLASLGVKETTIAALTRTERDIWRLLEHLAVAGGTVRWAATATGRSTQPSRQPWSHVNERQWAELRKAYVGLAAVRYETPKLYACPSDDGRPNGCALCGAAAVEALPSQADGLWFEASIDPATVGGREAPDSLDGFVCVVCSVAVDQAGGFGQSAMNRAVIGTLDPTRLGLAIPELDLIAWIAMPRGTAPNDEPWQHLDLGELRDRFG